MNKIYSFTVNIAGSRLDKYVSEKCPELSRTHAQKLITDGNITVNGHTVKVGLKLCIGDSINVIIPPHTPGPPSPEPIPLNIVYEDNDILVVDKPAGMAMHPAPGHPNHTLVNALLSYLSGLAKIDDPMRPGIVHRLDKDASGLVVVAKNITAQLNLINQFKDRSVAKTYLVLVKGRLTPNRGIIEAPIGRDPKDRKRMAVVTEGKEARTQYQVAKYISDYTLLTIKTETGRTHQIRVHLSAIGYPIAGDNTYGAKVNFLSRQFLHACQLSFNLPSTSKYVEFISPLPPDLAQALKKIT
jgi:23S rRNA pseudouridine1911/1915/1917 synthase